LNFCFYRNQSNFDAKIRSLRAIEVMRIYMGDFLQSIIPSIAKILENSENPLRLRSEAFHTLDTMCRNFNVTEFSSHIIHPILIVLEEGNSNLQQLGFSYILFLFYFIIILGVQTLCSLIRKIGFEYLKFHGIVEKVLAKLNITHSQYDSLIEKLK
jgi:FKBP12-rapamycin complex-associated protein